MASQKNSTICSLGDLVNGQEADVFALMTTKDELTTRDGKPYFRVGFRDSRREVQFPIWADSPWAVDCRGAWTPGTFYKLRAVYRETNYGPQLELRKVRATTDADAADGFDPTMLLPRSRFDPTAMFAELTAIATDHIANASGLLEHTLSVARTSVYLAQKYDDYYPEMKPRLDQGLVVAGAILHDIGKLRELEQSPAGPTYCAEGHLIGHILQGRDMVREAAAGKEIDREMLLRLEHIIVSHQRLPEWGSPKPPMTPEATIVHYADDLDAKYHMVVSILQNDASDGPVTSRKNVLGTEIFRGLP
jgi:3'-5' exoribonuclease